MRLPLVGDSVTARVLRTGRSTRMNITQEGEGPIVELVRRAGTVTTVGAAITVEGRSWGVITASWPADEVPPVDAEERLANFANLLDSAIANADSREQLIASRARVLTAGDEARRRVVRDLHDGAQQRLVHAIVTLTLARRALPADVDVATDLLDEALGHAKQGNTELRELAHGILPVVLTRGRPGGRRREPRRPHRPADPRRGPDREAAGRHRGERVLHRRRGADERRQARARDAR